mgnify:CR=1 FL=1
MNQIPRQEVFRKILHISASVIPISYSAIPSLDGCSLAFFLFVLLVIGIILEYARNRSQQVKFFFSRFFNFMMRNEELTGAMTGATWLLLGCFFSIILFPKEISVISMLLLTIGDTFAAIIGIAFPYGKYKGKTISGSLGGFILAGLLIFYFLGNVNPTVLIIGSVFAMLTELLPNPINDNLTIPIISGLAMFFIGNLF